MIDSQQNALTAFSYEKARFDDAGNAILSTWTGKHVTVHPLGSSFPNVQIQAKEYLTETVSLQSLEPTGETVDSLMDTLYRTQAPGQGSGTSGGFIDVPANAYYAKAVKWAVDKGVTSGTSATTFSPDTTCTRGQIVTFLYRNFAE